MIVIDLGDGGAPASVQFLTQFGPQGDKGDQGIQGVQGIQGIQGVPGPIAGQNTQVVYNDAGAAAGSASFTWNKATSTLTVAGTVNAPRVEFPGGSLSLGNAGNTFAAVGTGLFAVSSGHGISWSATGNANGGTWDVQLFRDGPGALALRNGFSPQALRAYNTYLDPANYSRSFMRVANGAHEFGGEAAGTGAALSTVLYTSTGALYINSNPVTTLWRFSATVFAPQNNNAQDLGVSGTNVFRSGYFGSALYVNSAGGSGVASNGVPALTIYGPNGAAAYAGEIRFQSLDGVSTTAQILASSAGLNFSTGTASNTTRWVMDRAAGHLLPGAATAVNIGSNVLPIGQTWTVGVQTIYGGWTDSANNYGLSVGWLGGGLQFSTFANGTGNGGGQPTAQYNANSHVFGVGVTGKWQLDGAGIRPYGIAGNSNTMDLGSSAYPVRTGYFGTSVTAPVHQFPAVQVPSSDPNAFDDYREGTFTAGLAFGGASVGIIYQSTYGSYTKIGNVVYFRLYVQTTNKGSSVGSLTVTGLPFVSNNTGSGFSPASVWVSGMTGVSGMVSAYVSPNDNKLLMKQLGTGSSSDITDANCGPNTAVMLTGFYFV